MSHNKTILDVYNLSKIYKIYEKPIDRLKEICLFGKLSYHKNVIAINNVSFSIQKGDRLGILGENGSGKSTLLKILSSVLTPSGGSFQINGRVSSLLELGTGFNPELTGRENVYQNGLIYNYTKMEMDERFPIIHDFSEIGHFVDQPVKTYSSGMLLRLAFACAVHVDPEILIIDEALSVGDIYFQNKCLYKIRELLNKGVTFIYVSHNTDSVKSLCNKGILLEKGSLIKYGSSEDISNHYTKFLYEKQNKSNWWKGDSFNNKKISGQNGKRFYSSNFQTEYEFKISEDFEKRVSSFRTGNGIARIKNVELLNSNEVISEKVLHGEYLTIAVHSEVYGPTDNILSLGVGIYDDKGIEINQFNSIDEGVSLGNLSKSDKFIIFYKFKNILKPGNYSITAGLANLLPSEIYKNYYTMVSIIDNCVSCYSFEVLLEVDKAIYGKVSIPVEVEFVKTN